MYDNHNRLLLVPIHVRKWTHLKLRAVYERWVTLNNRTTADENKAILTLMVSLNHVLKLLATYAHKPPAQSTS